MSAWLARSLAEQGQYAAAEKYLADLMRHPHKSLVTQVTVLAVAAGGEDAASSAISETAQSAADHPPTAAAKEAGQPEDAATPAR